MIFSRDRILTTHVGSLPRNDKLSDLLLRQEAGEPFDAAEMAAEMDKAVRHVVDKQVQAGIDIGNDGEQQRVGFQTYVPQRMSGFGGVSKRRRGREFEEFPELVASLMRRFPACQQAAERARVPERAALSRHQAAAERDRALQAHRRGQIRRELHDGALARHYFVDHAQRLLRHAGQIPDRAGARDEERIPGDPQGRAAAADRCARSRHGPHHDVPRSRRRRLRQGGRAACAAINKGIEGIPRERVRLHVCYGNWEGPHIYDIALAKILPALYQAKVGALSIEFANPRHAHEYAAFKAHPLPKDMLLIPGVVETTSNFVEHPEVVARRIEEAVARGRRARARDRRHRLRLRHFHQPRMGDRAGGVAEAEGAARGRQYRFGAIVGKKERGVSLSAW